MKLFILTLALLSLISCQLKNPQTISYDQLRLYAEKKESSATWTSKSRAKALGGMPSSSQAQTAKPLLGLSFPIAKELVRILDIRTEAEFIKKNLKADPDVKVPVVHIDWFTLKDMDKETLKNTLQQQDVTPENIVVLIVNPSTLGPEATAKMKSAGYGKTLYYENSYH